MSEATTALICDEMLIPITCVAVIKKSKNHYSVGRMNPTNGNLMTWDDLSNEGFNQMRENLLKTNEYKEKIKQLEKKIKLLEQHISLMPGGTEYLLAQNDFENQGQKQEKVDNIL